MTAEQWNQLLVCRRETMLFNRMSDHIHRATWRKVFRRSDLILDVGANVGQSYDRFRCLGYRGHIISYEPNLPSFRALRRHPGHHWRRCRLALSSSPGVRQFYRAIHFPTSQLNSFQYASYLDTEAVPVRTRRLDSMKFSSDRIFLKINTEGHDLEVFRGAEGLLNRIRYVMMEVAVVARYEGEPEFAAVVAELAGAGFKVLIVTSNYFCPKSCECRAMDVLFGR